MFFFFFVLFASLQGFSVHISVRPQYTARRLNNTTRHNLRGEGCIHFVCSSSNMMAIVQGRPFPVSTSQHYHSLHLEHDWREHSPFGLNRSADNEPGLIGQHQRPTSLMFSPLNGSDSLQLGSKLWWKALPVERVTLEQHISRNRLVHRQSTTIWRKVQVLQHFWP